MNLDYSEKEEAFRAEVCAFLRDKLPAALAAKVRDRRRLEREDFLQWQRILHAQGWGASAWPQSFGGPGWGAVERNIFDEECSRAHAPVQVSFGVKMVAPVIMQFGSPEQQQQHLPGIIGGTTWWCQGYSEPGAGSDLASLRTSAVRDGDDYIVNGQKMWTTMAHHADWIFCLVRTDREARKQEGISFLLIDMKTPGITVRPIWLMDGEREVNEVFFDNVRVPVANRIGEENKGWTYAKYLLGHERTISSGVGWSKVTLSRLKQLARRQPGDDGRPLIEDARFRDRIAQAELELMALDATVLKIVAQEGRAMAPGPEASILKFKGTQLQQQLTELLMTATGAYALPYLPGVRTGDVPDDALEAGLESADYTWTAMYFNYRKTTIYGGSDEVQRTIIAKHILGL